MRRVEILKCQSGLSMIEVMISAGILAIVGLGIATLMSSFSKQQRRMNEQLARTEAANFINQIVNTTSSCTTSLITPSKLTFNANSLPASKELPSGALWLGPGVKALSVGDLASKTVKTLSISRIELSNITNAGGPDSWVGEFKISFDNSKLVMALQPIVARTLFQTDPASPSFAKQVERCGPPQSLAPPITVVTVSPPCGQWPGGISQVTCPTGLKPVSCNIYKESAAGDADWFGCRLDFVGNRCVVYRDSSGGCDSNVTLQCSCY